MLLLKKSYASSTLNTLHLKLMLNKSVCTQSNIAIPQMTLAPGSYTL